MGEERREEGGGGGRGLYPPPHNPYGLHWSPLDSTGILPIVLLVIKY